MAAMIPNVLSGVCWELIFAPSMKRRVAAARVEKIDAAPKAFVVVFCDITAILKGVLLLPPRLG